MLRIFELILYLILLNTYISNNSSNASFLSALKNIFSNENPSDEQVVDKNNKPVELKVPINSYILNQIKEINNTDIENKEKNRIKDDNFNTIQVQQQQILGILGDYHYDRHAFNKCLVKVQSLILVIEFIKTFCKELNTDLKQLLNNLYDELNNYKKITNELYKSFNKILDIINLIKFIFKDNNGIIDKLIKLDNTKNISENLIEFILKDYVHQLDILLEEETIKYYDNNLHEILIKVRGKKSVLPSQLLFIMFNILKEEIINQNQSMNGNYILFKNKSRNINQKMENINDYIKDKIQSNSQYNTEKNDNKNNDSEKLIVSFINNNITELNRSNRDINDEIERVQSVNKMLTETLNVFKNYNYDERILSLIQEEKEKKQNRIYNKNNENTEKINNKSNEKDNKNYSKEELNKSEISKNNSYKNKAKLNKEESNKKHNKDKINSNKEENITKTSVNKDKNKDIIKNK